MAKRRSRVSICRSANRLHTSKRVEPFPKDLHKQTNKQTNQKAKHTHRGGSEGRGDGGGGGSRSLLGKKTPRTETQSRALDAGAEQELATPPEGSGTWASRVPAALRSL